MKARLVRIGNSQGVRIPKAVLRQCGMDDEVEMTVEDRRIVITPGRQPREGWDDGFRAAEAAGEDELLLPDDLSQPWDEEEWSW